ncbi:TIR domain-containing protein [Thiobacillus denitrificans]|nr:nucleotide-binding protein [Thiobacillus denitrificans]
MAQVAVALAKLAGIRKALDLALNDDHKKAGRLPIQNFLIEEVGRYFTGAATQLSILKKELPDLFGDFVEMPVEPKTEMAKTSTEGAAQYRYARSQLEVLARDIDQIFELRANSELAPPLIAAATTRRVFISHGRAPDWREVQAYVEKDIGLPTLELAQEPNQGRTILAKLMEASGQCDSAVIVMTGDDLDAAGQARARENVIHEIGFFQGKYGLGRVCLLHEEGVSIPSNIHGLVYTPFPKGMVSACFGVLTRELKAFY